MKTKLIAVTVVVFLLASIVVSGLMGIKQREQLNAERGTVAPALAVSVHQ